MQKLIIFSWRCPFQRQLLCFQTIESAKRTLAASADSSKFLENEKQQKKIRGNVFPLSPRSHAKIELVWTRKKNLT